MLGFSTAFSETNSLCRVVESIDDILNLSRIIGLPDKEPGAIAVAFVFSIVCQLLDVSLDDEGLLELTPEKISKWGVKKHQDTMEIDRYDGLDEKWPEHHGRLQSSNTIVAIELIGQFFQNKVTSRILYLARRNLYVFLASLLAILFLLFIRAR